MKFFEKISDDNNSFKCKFGDKNTAAQISFDFRGISLLLDGHSTPSMTFSWPSITAWSYTSTQFRWNFKGPDGQILSEAVTMSKPSRLLPVIDSIINVLMVKEDTTHSTPVRSSFQTSKLVDVSSPNPLHVKGANLEFDDLLFGESEHESSVVPLTPPKVISKRSRR
ncbi:hypothetical protein P9112_002349 [Eukaryota sp. TZLM1-RC]